MADDCCTSGDGCCAPPPLRFPDPQAAEPIAATSCDADAACGCHGGVPRFDGLDARYKFVLWTVIAMNGAMFLTEMVGGQLAGSQALKADALDFLADTVTYGLSLAVIGASLQTRATAALFKGLSLSVMAFWVLGSTIYHTIILGLPSAEVMGGIAVLALTANLASVLMLMRYKDGDANVRSVWLCSRNDAIGNRRGDDRRARGVEYVDGVARPGGGRAHGRNLSQLLRANPKAGLGGVPHRRPPRSRDGGLIGQMRPL